MPAFQGSMPLLLATTLCWAQSPDDRALELAREYSKAFVAGDCPTVTRLFSPMVADRLPEGSSLPDVLCPAIADFAAHHMTEELMPPIAALNQDRFRLVVIPSKRTGTVDSPPGTMIVSRTSLWIHSSDSGNTWHVLDLACVNAKWVKAIYPPYDGYPPVETATFDLVPAPTTR